MKGIGCFFRFMTLVVAVALLVSVCHIETPVDAVSAEGDDVSRLIYVVYDDSNSMLIKHSTAWSQAKYSLEIFASMLQEKDSLSVYFMSQFTDYHLDKGHVTPMLDRLSGEESKKGQNIDKIHNAVTNTWGTPIESIEYVYSEIKKEVGKYDECHMVVITDGNSFHIDGKEGKRENSLERLNSTFANCENDGVNVIYLAIGSSTLAPDKNQKGDVLVLQASPSDTRGEKSILNQVTEICKYIFQRPSHKTVGNKLDLKIPVSEIVVFAQGASVSIGDIPGTKKSTVSAGLDPLADKDKATINSEYPPSTISVADGLFGSVATFTPKSGKYISEGIYTLDVDATSYTVYYKPYLDVVLKIIDKNGKYADESSVSAGVYTAEYYLTYPNGHPNAGKPVDTGGLFTPEYTLSVNGVVNNSDEFTLDVGQAEVTVTAEYLNYIASDTSLKLIVVEPDAEQFSVNLTPEKSNQNVSDFVVGNSIEAFTVEVTKNDGSLLTSEEWDECFLGDESLSGTGLSEGIDFDVVKNSDGKTFTLTPKLKNGSRADTETGDVSFKARAFVKDPQNGRIIFEGDDSGVVEIYDDVANSSLSIEIIGVTTDIMSDGFNESAPRVTAKITWNGNPLTKAQYDALELMPEATSDLLVKDENGVDVPLLSVSGYELSEYKEGEHTTAVVFFVANGDAETQRIELDQNDGFKVIAKITIDGEETVSETKGELDVNRKYTPEEILRFVLWGLLVLFLLFGYVICKRYLPWRIKVVSSNGAISRKCVYRNLKTLITVLVPFLNVRGWVHANYEDHNEFTVNAIFKVKAKGPIFGLPKSGAPYAVLLNAVKLYENKGLYVDNSQNEIQSYLDAVGDNSQTDKPSIELDYTNSSVNDVNSFGPVAQFMNR